MVFRVLTPLRLQRLAQVAFAAGLAGAAALMLGPFQGLEQRFGLSDTAAHAIAFYVLTVGLFLSAPRTRRTDLAFGILAFGVIIELIQGQTGRSMSLSDVAADAAGVFTAVAPGLVERLRHHVRTAPNASFAQIAETDRRSRKAAAARSAEELLGF